MANRKTVFSVDVDDSAFVRFHNLFKQYNATLAAMPEAWQKHNAGPKEAADAVKQLGEELVNAKDELDAAEAQQRKLNEALERGLEIERERTRAWRDMAGSAVTTAKAVGSSAQSLLKLLALDGVFAGLAGIGGFFGLRDLASNIGDVRRTALGAGVSVGDINASRIDFSRLINPDAVLGNVAEAQLDPTKQWALQSMLGGGWRGANPADLELRLIERVKRLMDMPGMSLATLHAMGAGQLGLSDEDLIRIKNTPANEVAGLAGRYGADRKYGVTDAQARAAQDFTSQMERASTALKTKLWATLEQAHLPELVGHLSQSLVDFLTTLENNGKLQNFFSQVAAATDNLIKYLASPKFEADMTTFADDVAQVTAKLGEMLEFLGFVHPPGHQGPDSPYTDTGRQQARGDLVSVYSDLLGGGEAQMFALRHLNKGLQVGSGDVVAARAIAALGHFNAAAAAGIVGNLAYESGDGKGGLNPFAVKGSHFGIAQWDKDRQTEYFKEFHHTMQSVKDYGTALREQEQFLVQELREGHYKSVGWLIDQGTRGLGDNANSGAAGAIMSRYYENPYPHDKAKQVDAERKRAAQGNRVLFVMKQGDTTSKGVADLQGVQNGRLTGG